MERRIPKRLIRTAQLALTALLLVASAVDCGNSNPVSSIPAGSTTYPTTYPPAGSGIAGMGPQGCPVGTNLFAGVCVRPADFYTMCTSPLRSLGFNQGYLGAGGVITTVSGVQVCRATHRDFATPYDGVPILNPSEPTGPHAYNTGVYVRRNSRISFSGSAKWGYPEITHHSWLNGWFQSTTVKLSCSRFDLDGDNALTYEGYPAELLASDGSAIYELGSRATRVILNDGFLLIGINADPTVPGICGVARRLQFDITVCEDANHNTYPCT